jgi:hypothetical protein
MFSLTRNNRRKTTSARHTQAIDVPKYIINPKLNEKDTAIAKSFYALAKHSATLKDAHKDRPDLIIKNPNKFAGKRKFIFHARPTVK